MAQLWRDGPYIWVTWVDQTAGRRELLRPISSIPPSSTTSTIGYSFTILLSARHNQKTLVRGMEPCRIR